MPQYLIELNEMKWNENKSYRANSKCVKWLKGKRRRVANRLHGVQWNKSFIVLNIEWFVQIIIIIMIALFRRQTSTLDWFYNSFCSCLSSSLFVQSVMLIVAYWLNIIIHNMLCAVCGLWICATEPIRTNTK